MGAINESIWAGLAKEGTNYRIYRYDIANGDWTLVKEYTGFDIYYKLGMAWDGGFHVWYIIHDVSPEYNEYKRIKLSNLSVLDQPNIPTIKAYSNSLAQDWGRKT